ncbi:MAG: TolB family protein [Prevotella sp.]
MPGIYPDYCGVTIPSNIAPLNFCMEDDGYSSMEVHVQGSVKGEMECSGEYADFDIDEWHKLTTDNKGGKLSITVSAEKDGKWVRFLPFDIYVSNKPIKEWGITYRLVAPGYEIYGKQGIFQRCLSDFTESAIYRTTEVTGTCVNCHTPNATNPDDFVMHIRGEKGATIIRHNGKDEYMKSRNDSIGGPMVFPCWHPTGKYIAFSTNETQQIFHVTAKKRIEYFDTKSDIFIYNPKTHSAIVDARLATKDQMENCPVFSPDGRTLYYITVPYLDPKKYYDKSRYSLCRIGFNSNTGTLGERVDTLISAEAMGKSISWPRPSYDGRYLMFTALDYGYFSIWHPESDLWLLDLKTLRSWPLTDANSDDTDSFHNWSKSGGWFLFTSRRDDALYTRIYLAMVDSHGRSTKPFLLPQRKPREDNLLRMFSYNTPDFTQKKVEIEDMRHYINSMKRVEWGVKMKNEE